MGVTIRFKSLPTRDLPFTLPLPPHIPIFLSHRSNTFPPSLTTFVNNPFSFIFFQISPFPFFFFSFILPLRAHSESHKAHSQQTVAVVCERSVLSKQTHWAICYSTLHQAGSSEESAHHFNQPRQHTMNL